MQTNNHLYHWLNDTNFLDEALHSSTKIDVAIQTDSVKRCKCQCRRKIRSRLQLHESQTKKNSIGSNPLPKEKRDSFKKHVQFDSSIYTQMLDNVVAKHNRYLIQQEDLLISSFPKSLSCTDNLTHMEEYQQQNDVASSEDPSTKDSPSSNNGSSPRKIIRSKSDTKILSIWWSHIAKYKVTASMFLLLPVCCPVS